MLIKSTGPSSTLNQFLMGGLVVIWLAGMVYAFWWFALRDLRPFYQQQEQYALFESKALAEHLTDVLRKQGKIDIAENDLTLVHFWDPECLCSRFNTQHVQSLMEEFGDRGVKFLIVLNSASANQKETWQKGREYFPGATVISSSSLSMSSLIPASPATAVLDQSGQLAYFGPYSLGGLCLSSDDGLVETVLSDLLAGRPLQFNTISGSGCFCAWREQA